MSAIKRLLLVIIAVALIALALVNRQAVALHIPLFPEYTLEIPVYLFFFISMGCGVLFSGFAGIGIWWRHSTEKRASRKNIKKLEKEVDLLKGGDQAQIQAE